MRVSGVPWGGEHGHGPSGPVTMGIVHNSYGGYSGDVATVQNSGLAHFVIGKDEGQWIQLADTDSVTWNCGNWEANNSSVAIEFTGTSEEDLTDWQIRAGAHVIKEVSNHYGLSMSYDDGSNGPIDNAPFHGWYSHRAIQPDQGSQHSDFISWPEWNAMMASGGMSSVPAGGYSEGEFDMGQMEDLAQWEQDTREVILDALVGDAWKDGSKGILATWMQQQSGNVVKLVTQNVSANVSAAIKAIPVGPGGTITKADVEKAVEEALAKTHLAVS